MYFMITLHKQEFEKVNSQNIERIHKNEFFQWFKKYITII